MTQTKALCLILACGNTLRSDDGIGPWLAKWAEEKFSGNQTIRVISRHQWTPELAEEISQAESVLFIDCSTESAPGSVHLFEVQPSAAAQGLATHHQGAPELLALTRALYNYQPRQASLLTIGADSIELGEKFSDSVLDAIPQACILIEETVAHFMIQL
jgi:hydrogenase maturation protease